jgi:uncharacterized Zn-binding protein involved in type VI secretion
MSGIGGIGSMGIGTCPCHKTPQNYITTLITGAPTVLVNGTGAGQVGSIGVSSCGHPTVAITGSSTVFADGEPVHRVGDTGVNCGQYVLIEGSPNVTNSL